MAVTNAILVFSHVYTSVPLAPLVRVTLPSDYAAFEGMCAQHN
jgi:hypothetical protein